MAEGKPGLQTVTYKSIIDRDGPGVCRLQAPWDAEKAVSDRHNTRSVSAGQRAGEGWTQVPAPAGAQQTVTDVDSQQPLRGLFLGLATVCVTAIAVFTWGLKWMIVLRGKSRLAGWPCSVAFLTYAHLRLPVHLAAG